MAKVEKSIIIDAPVEKVFDFINMATNLPEIWPSMIEVKDLEPSSAGGYNFNWLYKMAGMRIEGASENIECIPNQRIVTLGTKGIETTFLWMCEPEAGGTKVTMEVEYTVPIPLLGKFAESFIVKQNEHEAETILANLKARMET